MNKDQEQSGIDLITQKLDGLAQKLDDLTQDIDTVKNELSQQFSDLTQDVDTVKGELGQSLKKVEKGLNRKVKKLTKHLDQLKRDTSYQGHQLASLDGEMLSLRHTSSPYFAPARPLVPQGNSLQESIEDHIPPNPFY